MNKKLMKLLIDDLNRVNLMIRQMNSEKSDRTLKFNKLYGGFLQAQYDINELTDILGLNRVSFLSESDIDEYLEKLNNQLRQNDWMKEVLGVN